MTIFVRRDDSGDAANNSCGPAGGEDSGMYWEGSEATAVEVPHEVGTADCCTCATGQTTTQYIRTLARPLWSAGPCHCTALPQELCSCNLPEVCVSRPEPYASPSLT